MTTNNYDHEAELKAAKRAEIERIWFNQEATNKELLQAYKALDIKKEDVWLWNLKQLNRNYLFIGHHT